MSASDIDEERTSICGSISAGTYVSERNKATCTLRHKDADYFANIIRQQGSICKKHLKACSISEVIIKKQRLNQNFHHLRFIVAILGGLAVGLMLVLRYNITVAVLSMVNYTALYIQDHPNVTLEELEAFKEANTEDGEFEWNNQVQQMIMSFYMIAHTLPQVPLTKLSTIIGSRWSIPLGLSLCALSTILTPLMAPWGWEWMVALRLINGLGSGPIFPMALEIVEKWMPYADIPVGLTCCQLVQALMQALNPLIIGSLCHLSWEYAFYVPGFASLGFCLIWIAIVSDHPDENWLISESEVNTICGCKEKHEQLQKYIQAGDFSFSLPRAKHVQRDDQADIMPKPEVKLTDILKQPSCYGYMLIWSFYSISCTCFTFVLPSYLGQFLKVSTAQTGSYCFVISAGVLISMIWPQPFLFLLSSVLDLSKTAANRVALALLSSIVAITWIYVGLFHEMALAMLFVNRCFQNSMDVVVVASMMANYAPAGVSSLVFSLVNSIGNFSVVFVSPLIGWFLDHTGRSVEGWSCIFYSLAVMQVMTLLFFNTVIDADPIEFRVRDADKAIQTMSISANDIEAKIGCQKSRNDK